MKPNTAGSDLGAVETRHLPAESTKAALERSPAPLDWQSLLQRCMGNGAFAERIVGRFQQRLTEDLSQLEENIKARQAELAAFAAHRLKGAAATVSAEAVRELAARLEEVARTGDLETAADCVARMRGELDRLVAFTALGIPTAGACPGPK
jgi:HPt (histidine-containing phosphotransfer) domain-containing protein